MLYSLKTLNFIFKTHFLLQKRRVTWVYVVRNSVNITETEGNYIILNLADILF